MPTEWTGILEGLFLLSFIAVGVVLLLIALFALRGGGAGHVARLRLLCPRLERPVDCTIAQDVRTGQWGRVMSCSAFPGPRAVTCDQECTQAMNLGFPLDGRRAG